MEAQASLYNLHVENKNLPPEIPKTPSEKKKRKRENQLDKLTQQATNEVFEKQPEEREKIREPEKKKIKAESVADSGEDYISKMPNEIICKIFSWLTEKDKIDIQCVSQKFEECSKFLFTKDIANIILEFVNKSLRILDQATDHEKLSEGNRRTDDVTDLSGQHSESPYLFDGKRINSDYSVSTIASDRIRATLAKGYIKRKELEKAKAVIQEISNPQTKYPLYELILDEILSTNDVPTDMLKEHKEKNINDIFIIEQLFLTIGNYSEKKLDICIKMASFFITHNHLDIASKYLDGAKNYLSDLDGESDLIKRKHYLNLLVVVAPEAALEFIKTYPEIQTRAKAIIDYLKELAKNNPQESIEQARNFLNPSHLHPIFVSCATPPRAFNSSIFGIPNELIPEQKEILSTSYLIKAFIEIAKIQIEQNAGDAHKLLMEGIDLLKRHPDDALTIEIYSILVKLNPQSLTKESAYHLFKTTTNKQEVIKILLKIDRILALQSVQQINNFTLRSELLLIIAEECSEDRDFSLPVLNVAFASAKSEQRINYNGDFFLRIARLNNRLLGDSALSMLDLKDPFSSINIFNDQVRATILRERIEILMKRDPKNPEIEFLHQLAITLLTQAYKTAVTQQETVGIIAEFALIDLDKALEFCNLLSNQTGDVKSELLVEVVKVAVDRDLIMACKIAKTIPSIYHRGIAFAQIFGSVNV